MKKKALVSLGLVSLILASRLLPHPANFVPVGAILVLFPGYAFVVMASLFLSDAFLGFHATMPYVYVSYALIGFIGHYATPLRKSFAFFTLPLLSSLLFYTVTNFGVWATTSMYTHDFSGLIQSYWMGIPFFRGTLLGDVFFFSVIYIVSIVVKMKSFQKLTIENTKWTIG